MGSRLNGSARKL